MTGQMDVIGATSGIKESVLGCLLFKERLCLITELGSDILKF